MGAGGGQKSADVLPVLMDVGHVLTLPLPLPLSIHVVVVAPAPHPHVADVADPLRQRLGELLLWNRQRSWGEGGGEGGDE